MTISSLPTTMPEGIAGMLDDSSPIKDIASKRNSETVNKILPGLMVMQGTGDDDVLQVSGAGALLVGIAIFGHSYVPTFAIDPTTGAYLPNITFDVLKHGRARVLCEGTLSVGNQVHVRHTANGGNATLGIFRATADAGKSLDISAFAQVVKSGSATTNPPVVDIDMTNVNLATAD
jgi:hypothetical protein